jgi:hypothetical protein
LPQRATETFGEARNIHVDFALCHNTALVVVEILDRILDGDDVTIANFIHVVHHRGESSRLA